MELLKELKWRIKMTTIKKITNVTALKAKNTPNGIFYSASDLTKDQTYKIYDILADAGRDPNHFVGNSCISFYDHQL